MMHRFISEIEAGEQIDDIYMVTEPVLRSTTQGSLYIAMFLSDKSGQVNGRMWQASEQAYKKIAKGCFIHINGRSEVYKNNLQIIVNQFSIVDDSKVSIEDFLARTEKDTEQMFREVKQIVATIKNPQIKTLVNAFLADEQLMVEFCKAPAAMKMHHNYLGGLLEHTHSMLKVAAAILPLYPQLQSDLVLGGIFLHDMGKIEELSYDMSFGYTDSGQLLGHITKTILMINKKANALAAKGKAIEPRIMDSLGHIVLSHHGQYEFGSPKLPATPEAFMVNYIDDLDAKVNQVTNAIDNDQGDTNWTQWHTALQRRLYRRRIEEV